MFNLSYKYILDSDEFGTLELQNNPDGWRKTEVTVMRTTYHGMRRKVSTPIKFVKDGYDYLSEGYRKYGVKWNVTCTVKEYDPAIFDYKVFDTYKIDFSFKKQTDIYFECHFTEVGLESKLKNGEDIDLNLASTSDILGSGIGELSTVDLKLFNRPVNYTAGFERIDGATYPKGSGIDTMLMVKKTYSDIDETQDVTEEDESVTSDSRYMLKNSDGQKVITVSGRFRVTITTTDAANNGTIYIRLYSSTGSAISSDAITTWSDSGTIDLYIERSATLQNGYSMGIVFDASDANYY